MRGETILTILVEVSRAFSFFSAALHKLYWRRAEKCHHGCELLLLGGAGKKLAPERELPRLSPG